MLGANRVLGSVKKLPDHFWLIRSGESAVRPRACDPPSQRKLSNSTLDSSLVRLWGTLSLPLAVARVVTATRWRLRTVALRLVAVALPRAWRSVIGRSKLTWGADRRPSARSVPV